MSHSGIVGNSNEVKRTNNYIRVVPSDQKRNVVSVAQLAVGTELKIPTVWVRVPPETRNAINVLLYGGIAWLGD